MPIMLQISLVHGAIHVIVLGELIAGILIYRQRAKTLQDARGGHVMQEKIGRD